ncbi:MAG: hypothetical protein K6E30_05630 [Lachnospiraceae bacterium]|nr:hypothetical protein [Lachnospiraceae bacterium]
MKNKFVRKLCSLVMAGLMVMGTASAVMADTAASFSGDGTTAISTIPFDVTLTAATGLSLPGTSFSYTIAPVAQDDISDEGVTEGVEGAVALPENPTAAFTAGDTRPATVQIPLTVDNNNLEANKVYRYAITQAKMSDAQVDSGILNEAGTGAADVRYLDIYTNGSKNVVYAVLFKSGTRSPGDTEIEYSSKDASFDNTFGKAGTVTEGDDRTDTKGVKTVTLSKTGTGNNVSADTEFPFTVTFSDLDTNDALTMTGVVYTVAYGADGKAAYGGDGDAPAAYKIGSIYNYKIKVGGTITFTVPNNVSVSVDETTEEGYTITATTEGLIDSTTVSPNASGKVYDANAVITFNNHRGVASPTGIVLRYAPYFLIAGLAAALLLFFRRRNVDSGSDMI